VVHVLWPGSVRADSIAASRLEQTLSEVASSLGSGGVQPRLVAQPTWALHTQIWLQLGTVLPEMSAVLCIQSVLKSGRHKLNFMRLKFLAVMVQKWLKLVYFYGCNRKMMFLFCNYMRKNRPILTTFLLLQQEISDA